MALAQGHNWLGREPVEHTQKKGRRYLYLEGGFQPTKGPTATGGKRMKGLTKIVWHFIHQPLVYFCFPLLCSFWRSTPQAILVDFFFLMSNFLPLSLLLFISKSILELPLAAVFHCRHQNINAVDSFFSLPHTSSPMSRHT